MRSQTEINNQLSSLVTKKYGLNDPTSFIRKTLGIPHTIISEQDIREQLKDPNSPIFKAMQNAVVTFAAIEYDNLLRSNEASQIILQRRELESMRYEAEKSEQAEESKIRNSREMAELEKAAQNPNATVEQKAAYIDAKIAANNVLLEALQSRYFELKSGIVADVITHHLAEADRIEERAMDHLSEMEQLYRQVYSAPEDQPRLQQALELLEERREIHNAAIVQRARAPEIIQRSLEEYQQAIPAAPKSPKTLPQGAERLAEQTPEQTQSRANLMQDILAARGKIEKVGEVNRVNAARRGSELSVSSPMVITPPPAPSKLPVEVQSKQDIPKTTSSPLVTPQIMQALKTKLNVAIRAHGDSRDQQKLTTQRQDSVNPEEQTKLGEKADSILKKLNQHEQIDKVEDKQADKSLQDKVSAKSGEMEDLFSNMEALNSDNNSLIAERNTLTANANPGQAPLSAPRP